MFGLSAPAASGRAIRAPSACGFHASARTGVLSYLETSRRLGLLGLLGLALAAPALAGDAAEALYRKGARAQRQGRHVDAYLLYSRARALAPANPRYVGAARGVRQSAARLLAAAGDHRAALELAPDSWEYGSPRREESAIDQTAMPKPPGRRRYRGPVRLRFREHETAFRFRGSLREAYEEAAAEFGVRIVFDEDFDGDQPVRADLSDCGFRCAFRALGDLGLAVAVPLARDLVLVARDTAAKRTELEPTGLAAISLDSAMTPEAVTEIAQAIQQVLEIKRFQASASGGLLFLRDSVTKVALAQALADDLMRPRGAVRIDLQLIAASRGSIDRFGFDLPTRYPVANFSTLFGAMPQRPGDGEPLIGVGGGKTVLGVTLGDAALLASLDASSSRSLQTFQIRAEHGAQAEAKFGERFPVVTAQYSSSGQAPNRAGFVQPPPSIDFQDLGLNLVLTPLVHSAQEVSLQLEANIRLLAGGAFNGIPVVANREFQSQVRLRRGEFAVVSGMSVYERRVGRSGLPGLGRLPGLGALFRRNEWRWRRSELLVLVRPHVVRLPPAELARSPTLLFGPEGRPLPAL